MRRFRPISSRARFDHVIQQNAALVEQSTAASENRKQQATRLAEAVGVFR